MSGLRNSACIISYGCQMNEYESRVVQRMLEGAGYEMTKDPDQAELVLLNTCTVRDNADQKIFNRLQNLLPQKRKFRQKKVGVLGCMVEAQKERLQREMPDIDFLLSPMELKGIANVLAEVTSRDFDSYEAYELKEYHQTRFQAFMPIQTGCNFNCSYCIVPSVKGREVNHSPDSIVAKIGKQVQSGVKEVTLLGQTINSYRWEGVRFADLLQRVSEEFPNTWIRFLTSHPVLFDERIIDVVASYQNLTPFFHIPAQSGSSKVLKSMKRGYTRESYLDLVGKMRAKVPGVALSTDMICGFPDESSEDFEESLSLMEEVRFETAFMFYYSERKDTPAAGKEQIPLDVRKERLARMIEHQMEIQKDVYSKKLGETVLALVETSGKQAGTVKCKMACGLPVFVPSEGLEEGDFVQVKLRSCTSHSFQGEVIHD